MKKIFILPALVLTLVLPTACNNAKSDTTTQKATQTATASATTQAKTSATPSASEAKPSAPDIKIPVSPIGDVFTIKKEDLPQLNSPKAGDIYVNMKTTMGNIKLVLYPKYAPKTVENFVTHAKNGYYNGLTFHRVVKDFMIQGGDPKGDGSGGESIWKKPFEDEFSPYLYNIRGAISMANAGPNTNGSQFFIVQNKDIGSFKTLFDYLLKDPKNKDAWAFLLAPQESGGLGYKGYGFANEIMKTYNEKGGVPFLDYKHTVFGQVVEGMDVVDKIAAAPVVVSSSGEKSAPKDKIKIESITIEDVK